MEKTLRVRVDKGTWPKGKSPPASLIPANNQASVDVLDMMLKIGSLAIPPLSTDVSINVWWAWLRYAFAFSDAPKFQLKASYADLDAHQKSVLSDDFGMGVALSYLIPALDLQSVFDGRYFVHFLAPSVGASAVQIAKNGQFKSPDFIGLDSSGRWHAIECKGTQTSHDARREQVKAGRQQKTNVIFPAAARGEKLVSALLIGREAGSFGSALQIVDPENEIRIRVPKSALPAADEAMRRATLARALGVIGYPNLAASIAAPYGEHAYDRETSGDEELARLEAVRRKRAAISPELDRVDEPRSDRFTTSDRVGRETLLSSPRPITIADGRYTRVRGRLSMARHAFDLAQNLVLDGEGAAGTLKEMHVVGIQKESSSAFARLVVGSIFEAEIELLQ